MWLQLQGHCRASGAHLPRQGLVNRCQVLLSVLFAALLALEGVFFTNTGFCVSGLATFACDAFVRHCEDKPDTTRRQVFWNFTFCGVCRWTFAWIRRFVQNCASSPNCWKNLARQETLYAQRVVQPSFPSVSFETVDSKLRLLARCVLFRCRFSRPVRQIFGPGEMSVFPCVSLHFHAFCLKKRDLQFYACAKLFTKVSMCLFKTLSWFETEVKQTRLAKIFENGCYGNWRWKIFKYVCIISTCFRQ